MRPLAAAASAAPTLSPDDAADAAARGVLRFHLRRFREHEAGARAGDVEGVHQLRVATRRLRAALRLFEPMLARAFVRSVRRDLGWLADAIGQVRDLDVLAAQVQVRAARLTPESRKTLGPLAMAMHDQRQARHADLVAVLDSTRCRRLLDRLTAGGEPLPTGPSAPLGAVAPELVRPLLRALLRTGRQLGPDSPAESLHRLRVRGKRLRYALETVRGLGGKSLQQTLRRLSDLQDVLGAGQDGVMAIAWLRAYAETVTVPPTTLVAIGGLVELLARRTRKLRQRFPDAWERLDRRRLRTELLAELAAGARRRPRAARPGVLRLRTTAS